MTDTQRPAGPTVYGKVLVVVLIFAGAGAGVFASQYAPIFGGVLEKNIAQPWSKVRVGLIGEHVLALSAAGAAVGFLFLWLRGSPADQRRLATAGEQPGSGDGQPHWTRRRIGAAVAGVTALVLALGFFAVHRPLAMQTCRRLEESRLVMNCRAGDGATTVFDAPPDYAGLISSPGSIEVYSGDPEYRSHIPSDSDGAGNDRMHAVLKFPGASPALYRESLVTNEKGELALDVANVKTYEAYKTKLRNAFTADK